MEDKEILQWLEKTIAFKKQTLSIAQKLNSTVCLKESIEHLEVDSIILQAIKGEYEGNESILDREETVKWINYHLAFKKPILSVYQDSRHRNPVVKELAEGLEEDIKMLEKIKKDYENKEARQEPILTNEEREYLKSFLKPYRDQVEFITKNKVVHADDDSETNFQYLYIMLDHEYIQLPMFKKGTIYKGMELDYDYTLKELGITYDCRY